MKHAQRNTLLVAVPSWEHAKFPQIFVHSGTAAKRVFLRYGPDSSNGIEQRYAAGIVGSSPTRSTDYVD